MKDEKTPPRPPAAASAGDAARIPYGSLDHYENATEEIYRRDYGDLVQIRSGQREFLTLRLGGEPYAVDLQGVLEVTRATAITPVPFSPPWLLGVMILRGSVVPVFHVARMLGMTSSPRNEHAERVLLVARAGGDGSGAAEPQRRPGSAVGLLVDEVREVVAVPDEALGPAPQAERPRADFVSGIARRVRAGKTEIFVLLNHARLASALPDDPAFVKAAE